MRVQEKKGKNGRMEGWREVGKERAGSPLQKTGIYLARNDVAGA